MSGTDLERPAAEPRWERVAVLGLGLLGGSLAWATRERRVAREVVGFARRSETLRSALESGLVDRGASSPAAA